MSDRRIQAILESITDTFIALDRQWRFTYLNDQALDHMGSEKGEELTREGLLGKNFWEEFPELVGTTLYQELHRALREQEAVEVEAYFPRSEEWLEVHAYPSEEGVAMYSRDITQPKREQMELETRTRQQAVVAELGLRALANDGLQSLMDDEVASVARTLGVEYVKIVELLPGGEELLMRAGKKGS
jgi:PAS domain S-box-containing protein